MISGKITVNYLESHTALFKGDLTVDEGDRRYFYNQLLW